MASEYITIKEKLCCESTTELDMIISCLSAYISNRIQPSRTARQIMVKLFDDADNWRKLKDLLK